MVNPQPDYLVFSVKSYLRKYGMYPRWNPLYDWRVWSFESKVATAPSDSFYGDFFHRRAQNVVDGVQDAERVEINQKDRADLDDDDFWEQRASHQRTYNSAASVRLI